MADLPMPVASRVARPRWLDARLLSGLLLILISVVVGAKLFAEVDERVEVWALTRDLGANATLSETDLVARAVRLDDTARRYVSADEDLAGLVLNRAVGRNELLPLAALSDRNVLDQRRVAIEVDRFSATGLKRGSVVDLYAVPESKSADVPAQPNLVLSAVTVAEDVKAANRNLGAGGAKTGVTLLVPGGKVPTLIEAMANSTIYLVEVPVSARAKTRPAL